MKSQENKVYDVAVIGGGPAGMISAGRAAEKGASVILLEKNPSLGVKLLITGGGRSNITNHELDVRTLLSKYKENDKFLFSAFSQFSVQEALDFFHTRTMDTKTEAEKRVFPKSNKAQSVWDVLVDYMKKSGVTVQTNSAVRDVEVVEGKITAVILKNNTKIFAKKFILATGGTSRPETGSTGDGFAWLSKLGHTVVIPSVALVPIALKDPWIKKLSGVTLRDIKLTTFQNDVKQEAHKGKLLFTHFGISGPTILNMSRDIDELLKYGEVEIRLDLLPALDHGMMNKKLQELFKYDDKKKIKNSLDAIIPSALVDHILELAKVNPDTKNNSVTREERLRLIDVIKGIPMQVDKLLGSDKAVVSSGGVDLKEVDFKTMQSRIVPNLYLVGDVLNIDRPSGGYSLQLCWTTGWVAGSSI
ncbi:MAG: aminoacetone oxidase family FAD-binding enzyme [Patescibacteria group bacterium]